MNVDKDRLRLVKARWVETGKITSRDVDWLLALAEPVQTPPLSNLLDELFRSVKNDPFK